MRTCSKCGEEKSLEEFHKVRRDSERRRRYCKTCHKQDCKKNHRKYTLERAPEKPTYLITDGEFLKIGVYKGDLATRIHGLQNGNPRRLSVIATSSTNIEKLCHYEFDHLCVLNEWFKFDLSIVHYFTEHAE